MLSMLVLAAALCAAPDDAELIQTLAANWSSQRSAIATAHFRGRAFRSGDVDPLAEAGIDAAFKQIHPSSSVETSTGAVALVLVLVAGALVVASLVLLMFFRRRRPRSILAICAALLCAAANASDDAELMQTLAANWEGQRAAIATAHFRARAFRSGDMEPLQAEEVAAAFRSVDLAQRPDDLRQLVPLICRHKKFATSAPWSAVEILVDGARLRERTISSPGALDDNVVDRGITVIGMGGARQASILRSGNSRWRIRALDDFRFIPAPSLDTHVLGREHGRVRLGDSGDAHSEFEVDETTGFAHSWRFYLDGGVVASEILQFGPVSYPGDVVLPTAIARLSYSNGTLANADVLVIEHAEINTDLPPDTFVAKASKGTLIVDHRDPRNTKSFYAKGGARHVDENEWQTNNGFMSLHPGGANFCFADAHVRFLSDEIDLKTYRAAAKLTGKGSSRGRSPSNGSSGFKCEGWASRCWTCFT